MRKLLLSAVVASMVTSVGLADPVGDFINIGSSSSNIYGKYYLLGHTNELTPSDWIGTLAPNYAVFNKLYNEINTVFQPYYNITPGINVDNTVLKPAALFGTLRVYTNSVDDTHILLSKMSDGVYSLCSRELSSAFHTGPIGHGAPAHDIGIPMTPSYRYSFVDVEAAGMDSIVEDYDFLYKVNGLKLMNMNNDGCVKLTYDISNQNYTGEYVYKFFAHYGLVKIKDHKFSAKQVGDTLLIESLGNPLGKTASNAPTGGSMGTILGKDLPPIATHIDHHGNASEYQEFVDFTFMFNRSVTDPNE